jgi:hypothetical protein
MTRAWTKRILVGCLLAGPIACVVSVNDDPLDEEVGGASGGSNVSGSSGSSGASGNGGGGGNGAQGGSGGSLSMVENGGSGGASTAPAPVCTAEAGDAQDSCLSCIKRECCTEWQACTDASCQRERVDLELCVSDQEAPDSESFGDCASMVSTTGDFLQENTQEVFDCVNEVVPLGDAGGGGEKTRCGVECFGEDIFF